MSNKKKGPNLSSLVSQDVKLRTVRGQVVVTNRPRQRPDPTEKQLAAQGKFLKATQYANHQISQEESRALYATGITNKKHSVYLVAISDYLIAPTVENIDTVDYRGAGGDPIVVNATDDFMVTRVKVIITDPAGAILEEGEAGPDAQRINLWVYKAKAANPSLAGTTIKAIAYDRPGNVTSLEKVM